MRVLSERETWLNTLQEVRCLPEAVHSIIACSGGIGRGRLTRAVARSLPKSIETAQVIEWVETILSYLIVRGDVERGAGATYLSLPPYAIESLAEDASDARYIRLYGDVRGDRRLLKRLNPLDPTACIAHLQKGVYASAEDHGDTTDSMAEGDEGAVEPDLALIDRTLRLNTDVATTRYEEVAEIMEECGYRLFCLGELATDLPSIHGLLCPPEHDLKDAAEIGGNWEAYVPAEEKQESWVSTDTWHDATYPLVRKRGLGDEMAEMSRSFYHGGGGMVSELGREEAVLWLHYLNWLEGHPESAIYNGGTLYIPNNLSPSMVRWLELVTGRRLRKTRGRMRLDLPEGVARYVQRVLVEKLGVKARDSFPRRVGPAGRREQRQGYRRYGR